MPRSYGDVKPKSVQRAEELGFYPRSQVLHRDNGRVGKIIRYNGGTVGSPKVKVHYDDGTEGYPSINKLIVLAPIVGEAKENLLKSLNPGDVIQLIVESRPWILVQVKKFQEVNYLLLKDPHGYETDRLTNINVFWLDGYQQAHLVHFRKTGSSNIKSFKANLATYQNPEQKTLAEQGYFAGNVVRLQDGTLAIIHRHTLLGYFILSTTPGQVFKLTDLEIIQTTVVERLW